MNDRLTITVDIVHSDGQVELLACSIVPECYQTELLRLLAKIQTQAKAEK